MFWKTKFVQLESHVIILQLYETAIIRILVDAVRYECTVPHQYAVILGLILRH